MAQEEINIKEVKKRIKAVVNDNGLEEAHKIIKRDYEHYPEMKKLMLFILYLEYPYYPFKDKEKLDKDGQK